MVRPALATTRVGHAYVDLMAEWCDECGVEIRAYCLMPNHIHMMAVPRTEEVLARAIGEAHRRYSRMVNFREGWLARAKLEVTRYPCMQ